MQKWRSIHTYRTYTYIYTHIFAYCILREIYWHRGESKQLPLLQQMPIIYNGWCSQNVLNVSVSPWLTVISKHETRVLMAKDSKARLEVSLDEGVCRMLKIGIEKKQFELDSRKNRFVFVFLIRIYRIFMNTEYGRWENDVKPINGMPNTPKTITRNSGCLLYSIMWERKKKDPDRGINRGTSLELRPQFCVSIAGCTRKRPTDNYTIDFACC